MEELLHYVWKHRLFPLGELHTTEEKEIEVIDVGKHNERDAGPDFFNAKLKIDGTLWAGNIEIHLRSSDWNRHGHQHDDAYQSVILHIVTEADTEVTDNTGRRIPQLQMDCPSELRERFDDLRRADFYPPCYDVLASLSPLIIHSWMSALQYERLEQKYRQVMARVERCNRHWEDAFFVTLARNFGFGLNSEVFERWGAAIPLRAIDKHRDNLFQIEALFFGQAGLLDDETGDDYYQCLRHEYAYLAHKFDLQRMGAGGWRLLRTRPGNFPHVRIAQLAWLYYQENGLLSRLLEAPDVDAVRRILCTRTSDYWETHYTFGHEAPRRTKTLSHTSQDLLIINTVVPSLFAYGRHKSDEVLTTRALAFWEALKPENNYITRQWSQCGLEAQNAADTQALIQLKKQYCDERKCLYCRFGYEYLRRR